MKNEDTKHKIHGNVLPNGLATKRQAYNSCKANADKYSRPFTLTFEEFLKLASSPCYYCGRPPSNLVKGKGGEDFIYQGIDREDNNQGYTRSNSVPCCFTCNDMKGTFSHIEFLALIIRIYKYSVEDVKRSGY